MPDDSLVIYDLHGDVAIITLDDQSSLNGATRAMMNALLVALERAEGEARCIVVTGAGRGFCSGAKLDGELGVGLPGYDAGAALETHFNPIMSQIRSLRIPLVTAVNGPAAGFGASLALAGDIIVASTSAFFLQAFCNIGLVPDAGSAFLLVHSAGRARAMEMMLLGERISAATALEWGMINRLVEPEAMLALAIEIATRLAAGPTVALAMIRNLGWRALETGFDDTLKAERLMQRDAGQTADHQEGVAAFMEKRSARFIGR